MTWCLHWWLVQFLICHAMTCNADAEEISADPRHCMEDVSTNLTKGDFQNFIKVIDSLQKGLENTNVMGTTSMSAGNLVALLNKANPSTSLKIHANNNEAKLEAVSNSKVIVQLPKGLGAGPTNTVVFCMVILNEQNRLTWGGPGLIYDGRLVGLSVSGTPVSGLQECVNITINMTTTINETQEPMCVFLNFTTKNYSSEGCQTLWERDQTYITCSCDHLTYFTVLIVNSSPSPSNQKILSYITLIGCSLSLFGLSIAVLLFITHKKFRADVSMKVHISLVFALILLNVHFLPSEMVAALSSNSLCVYMALALHYSLLATFSWMALEGFHLYLLLVRVFNIYIRRYLLKLSVVGWGVPAVIVSLVVIIDQTAYGYTPVDSSNPNGTAICYVTNTTAMMVTTMGMICLVFLFNVIMLGVTVRRLISLRQGQETNRSSTTKDIFTLLGISTLLGITWGVGFFSVTTAGQYVFCILNSLQGFLIFLWFVMSLRKAQKAAAEIRNDTQTTSGPKSK
ncbi:adhesion G-protein coupled receptor G2-like isoform X2 [Betta splendens]|nr:adhesion G-protein coupled receptor G2-like isoform X2 [Betta splendens]XP_055363342.1 adhesion G-protein coupled receptor G2-like isoform X2 [Betta splendens]